MYSVSTEETSTTTPNNVIARGTTDTSGTVETSSSTDNTISFNANTVSTVSIPTTDTVPSTYFISTSIAVAIPKESLASATMVDTGTAVPTTFISDIVSTAGFETFPDFTGRAGTKADTTPSGSLGLETDDNSTSSVSATFGIYTTNEILSTTRLNDSTATSTGAPTTAAIPELNPRSDGPPCNLAADCAFTAGSERTFSADVPITVLPPDVSITPGLVSFPDISPEVPDTSTLLPSIPGGVVPLTLPSPNISPPDEGQPKSPPPFFDETFPNKFLPDKIPPPDSPLITLSPTQSPQYIIRPNVPLPDKPLPAVPPKELGFDDPSVGVSLVEVLTPDIPFPAVPRPDLPLLDISPEVPRPDETPPDTRPTYLSPVDVLTADISSTKVPLLDIVPGRQSSESPDDQAEPPLDRVPADVSVESILSPSEPGAGSAAPDNTVDWPDSGNDLAPVEFTFPFLENPESVTPVLDSVPVPFDDPQNLPDDSSAPAEGLRSDLLDSGQNYVLNQPNTNEKVDEKTGSTGLISSTENNASKDDEPDLNQALESVVVQVERQSSLVTPIQESDRNKGPKDKNKEVQKQEEGTWCSSNWLGYTGMMMTC